MQERDWVRRRWPWCYFLLYSCLFYAISRRILSISMMVLLHSRFEIEIFALRIRNFFQEFSRKEKSTKFPHWISFLINFSHILLILNSSVNIFIYLLKVIHQTRKMLNLQSFQDSKFRKECVSSLKRHTLINNTRRGQNKRNPAMSTLTNKNLSVDTFFKFSKSDSLDSTYSRATSIFGFSSSRQSSQVIPFKLNILWNFLFPGTGHRSWQEYQHSELLWWLWRWFVSCW